MNNDGGTGTHGLDDGFTEAVAVDLSDHERYVLILDFLAWLAVHAQDVAGVDLAPVEHGRVFVEEITQRLLGRLLQDEAVPAQQPGQLTAKLGLGHEIGLEELLEVGALLLGLLADDVDLVLDLLGIDL